MADNWKVPAGGPKAGFGEAAEYAKEWKGKPPPASSFAKDIKYPGSGAPAVVESGARTVAGKILGAAAGQAAGVLLTPTPAGAGSDQVPPPSERQMAVEPRAKGGPVKKGGALWNGQPVKKV